MYQISRQDGNSCTYSMIKILLSAVFTVHVGKKTKKCLYCDASFSANQSLRKHIETVLEGKKFVECNLCETIFQWFMKAKSLKLTEIHEREKLYHYHICLERFSHISLFRPPLPQIERKHTCNICVSLF